jgi:hypothetical protein
MPSPHRRSSQVGHTDKGKRVKKPSLARSIGSIRKHEKHEESAISSMQQLHLLRKQKIFLLREEQVFTNRIAELREQIQILDKKIADHRDQAKRKFHEIDERDRKEVEEISKETSQKSSKQKKKLTNNSASTEEGIAIEY